jgi:hypothetical protein
MSVRDWLLLAAAILGVLIQCADRDTSGKS